MPNTTPDTDAWISRIRAAHDAAAAARAQEERIIRDAANAGVRPTLIAREGLGTQNKNRVYGILGRGAGGRPPAEQAITPVVYLRGAGNSDGTWARMRAAMWARGWATVSDRTSAWHLARGGAPVVFCDFSADLDETPGNSYGYDLYVIVGMVRARCGTASCTGTVFDLLETKDAARHAGQPWLEQEVTVTSPVDQLPLVNGGKHPRPQRWDRDALNQGGGKGAHVLDVHAMAGLVADAFDG